MIKNLWLKMYLFNRTARNNAFIYAENDNIYGAQADCSYKLMISVIRQKLS